MSQVGETAEQQARGVGLGIAANDHDLVAHLGQTGHGVFGGGGFADAAFSVDCNFSHNKFLVVEILSGGSSNRCQPLLQPRCQPILARA
jgi:hypothetical protein